jgi:transcriptional regulator with XRE-family HTH domain
MNKTVGDKIKFLRIQSGLSQEELGKHLYFSNRTISNWENNLREVSMDNLSKLAAYFNVNVSYFIDNIAEPTYQIHNAYRQIKYMVIENKSYFFLTIFSLILINLFLIFIPFSDRETLSSLTLLVWVILMIYTIYLYQDTTKKRTHHLLVPNHTNVYFEHKFSLKEKKIFYYSFIANSIFTILFSFLIYASVYVMIRSILLDESYIFLFTSIVAFFTFSVSFFQLFQLIRFVILGFPKNTISYNHTNIEFGIFNVRLMVSMHYGFIVFLTIILINYGFQRFNLQEVILNVIGIISLVCYLKLFLDSVINFYRRYKIILKNTELK